MLIGSQVSSSETDTWWRPSWVIWRGRLSYQKYLAVKCAVPPWGVWITTEVGDMLPPRHQTVPAAEHQYQRYQIILLDDNRGTCANKLPTVVTREWNGRESNLPPLELHVQLPDHCTIRRRKVSAGPTFQNVRQHTWQTEMVHEPYGVKRISGMHAIIINVFSKTVGHRNSRKKSTHEKNNGSQFTNAT